MQLGNKNLYRHAETPESLKVGDNVRSKGSNPKIRAERLNSTESSSRKKRNKNKEDPTMERANENQPETWSKIIRRKEKRKNRDREANPWTKDKGKTEEKKTP